MGYDGVIYLDQVKAARRQQAANLGCNRDIMSEEHETVSDEVNFNLAIAQVWHLIVADRLKQCPDDLRRTVEFCQACREACDLTDIEAMERARDELVEMRRERALGGGSE
ncbi:hypothetical protein GGE65_005186 [Skermanella aerolata]|uniref:hypothetical protein n=1 Tax=Skermanella aerolata TaxID=393310 RepID=UPI003D1F5FFF